jgi:hypothetical protein
LASAFALALLGVGLSGTPASALNHDTYNILRNAGLHQYCLDIRTEDPPRQARAHLWTCTHPVVGEQEFLLVSDSLGHDHIKVLRSGYCVEGGVTPEDTVSQTPCSDFDLESWDLRDTGEIVNVGNLRCLDAKPADTKNADVIVAPCNGSISQRWFF